MLKKKSSPLRSDDGCNLVLLNEYRSFIFEVRNYDLQASSFLY